MKRSLTAAGLTALALSAPCDLPRHPFPMDWSTHAATAVDLSAYLDAPAGRDGFIRADGRGHLVKPDGSRFRIWGVNLSGSACFPEKTEADVLSDRLARLGVNAVRLHFIDSKWGNLFDKSRDDTRALNPVAMDRFDALVAALKRRGIYVNLNLNVARQFKPGDGVRDADKLGFGKGCTYFNPRLIELQHEYARQFLTHKNPYTGNEYRQEPAVATVEIVNENALLEGWLFWRLVGKDVDKTDTWSPIPVSYAEELTDRFNDWLVQSRPRDVVSALRAEAGVASADGRVPRLKPDAFNQASALRFRTEAEFYMALEHDFFADMKRLLKEELHVQAPIVGTSDHNHSYAAYAHVASNAMFDWIDGHGYWQHPDVNGPAPTCLNTPMVNDPLNSLPVLLARTPVEGRPFTISEVNHPFPHEYVCEGFPILTAYAMFQDWDGIYWYTWDGGRTSSDGGIPPRAFFSVSYDPVKVATLMASAAWWHQSAVAPARKTVVRSVTREQALDALRMDRREKPFFMPGFDRATPLVHATRVRLGDGAAQPQQEPAPRSGIRSDTGELSWTRADRREGVVIVDAPAAQALIGFVRDGGERTRHVSATITNAFCTLALASLDRKPVADASRLLLAAAAWCGNTDMAWDSNRRGLTGWGHGPTQIEPIAGKLFLSELKGATSLRAQALTAAGSPTGVDLPVSRTSGGFAITLGAPATTLVLLEVER